MTVYPNVFTEADLSSVRFQRSHWRLFQTQLVLLVLAAILGNFTIGSSPDWSGVGLLVCFFGSLSARVAQLTLNPEGNWYSARAAAESIKTLVWRYSMRIAPFDGQDCDSVFSVRLVEVLRDSNADIGVSSGTTFDSPITQQMRERRALTLPERMAVYRNERIVDQATWYRRKAALFQTYSRRLDLGALLLQAAGVVLGVLRSISVLSVDIVGLCGAVAGSIIGWQQARNYKTLSTAYALAARELEAVEAKALNAAGDELTWATFVADAEEAISREHTMWRASRS
jgi:hypothetical protein